MKKLALFAVLLFIVSSFAGCGGGDSTEVQMLGIYVNDGVATDSDYSEATIELVPDYELRSLTVTYSHFYPNRTENTPEIDLLDEEGVMAGERFDEFENIVNWVEVSDLDKIKNEEAAPVAVLLSYPSGEQKSMNFAWDAEGVEPLQSFYGDLVNSFEANKY